MLDRNALTVIDGDPHQQSAETDRRAGGGRSHGPAHSRR